MALGAVGCAGGSAPPPVRADQATIVQSASTNTRSISLVVTRGGSVTYTLGNTNGTTLTPVTGIVAIAASTASQLFADLDAASPLSALPGSGCVKSVSFGTSTTIVYGGQTTPDVSCETNPAETSLYNDTRPIFAAVPAGQGFTFTAGPSTKAP